jgi:hypothetical protein
MSDLLQLANELSEALSWGPVSQGLLVGDEGKPKAKPLYWVPSAPVQEKFARKGSKSLERLVHILACSVIDLVDYVFDGDYSRNSTSRELATLLDRVDTALEGWGVMPVADACKGQRVVALGYEYAAESGERSQSWGVFTRDVRQVDGVWTAKVLHRVVPVRFDESKGVWFEVKR